MIVPRPPRAIRRAAALAALVASARALPAQPAGGSAGPAGPVVPGVEVLLSDSLRVLQGKRVGLITNHTGRDRRGTSTVDLLAHAPGVTLAALFGPEHGIRGTAEGGAHVANAVDSATGVPIYSLYGATRVPTPAMLKDVDVLVYDIQDVGTRGYTYVWTMALAAEAAGKLGKPFVVLDRPDPIRADVVQGGIMRPEYESFTGQYPVALRYGLTPGELLRWLVGTGRVHAQVTVVPMRGYRRSLWYDETGLPWVAPSPNIRDLTTALLYAGTILVEATGLSEGRGTDHPLELVGAPWLTDAAAIADSLNARGLPGARLEATRVAVARGEKFGGRTIPAVAVVVTARDSLRPIAVVGELLRAIHARHPKEWQWERGRGIEELTGSPAFRQAVDEGGMDRLLAEWAREGEAFQRETRPYWLYPP